MHHQAHKAHAGIAKGSLFQMMASMAPPNLQS